MSEVPEGSPEPTPEPEESVEPTPLAAKRRLRVGGFDLPTPIYFPVYQPKDSVVPMEHWVPEFGIQALILNAFFLYKDREVKARFADGMRLKDHIGFDGVVMTDSGAFQGLKRPLYLKNRKIVKFQDSLGADIISPLDLISPPWDKRTVAEKKLNSTLKRVREAVELTENSVIAGVQQGGRFRDLRQRATDELLEMGVSYLALGSLVPFFNKGHAMRFVGEVIGDARRQAGNEMPMHIYGAGDPVELPFLAAMGADIFDSSAYGHYAQQGWYMTPFGALRDLTRIERGEWACDCRPCTTHPVAHVHGDLHLLGWHNLHTVVRTLARIRGALDEGNLDRLLQRVLEVHGTWFPESQLGPSWQELHGG